MNSDLYGNTYPIPQEVLQIIYASTVKYPNSEGVKRAKNLLDTKSMTYQQMKRLKNFFDHPTGGNEQIELAGGDGMRRYIESKLTTERSNNDRSREMKRDYSPKINSNFGVQNASINAVHENDDKTVSKEMPSEMTINATAIIFNNEMRILLLKRSSYEDQWMPNLWSLVGGGVENNEAPIEGIKREIKEETGLGVSKIIEKLVVQRSTDTIEHIYVAKYEGDVEDVQIDFENAGFGWFTHQEIRYLNTVPNLIDYINMAITKYE